jgi:hypothetical protein
LVRTNGTKAIVGKGLTTHYYEVRVQRLINGVVSGGADAVTVNLRCVATDVCTTPATTTIAAGQSEAYVYISGVEVGSTQIEATAIAHEASYLNVETISAVLSLQNIQSVMTVGQKQTSVYVNAAVPGTTYAQVSTAPFLMTLSSSVPSVGVITNSANWAANSGSSGYATFSAVAQGTTQITASSPGFVPATSGVITVNP